MSFLKTLSFSFLILQATILVAQSGKTEKKLINIGIIDFSVPSEQSIKQNNTFWQTMAGTGTTKQRLESIQSIVIEQYTKDARFQVIERRATESISRERELQKKEDFMDGYVVNQGKAIGADYLVFGHYELQSQRYVVSLLNVAEGKIVGKEPIEIKGGVFMRGEIIEPTVNAIRRLNEREFPLLMQIVKITDQSSSKAKELLIAGGKNRGLQKLSKLDVKMKDQIEVEGEMQTYYKTVGEVQILNVEDSNFSTVRVTENGTEIKALLEAKTKLFCTFKPE